MRRMAKMLVNTPLSDTRDTVAPAAAIVWEAEVADAGFRVRFVNDAALALLDYPRDAWQGAIDFWLGITHPDDRSRARRHMLDALASSATGPSIVRWIRADGTVLSMEVHVAPITNAGGAVVGLRGFALEASRWAHVRDELTRAQEQLAYASRRAMLNELVASLVHEINQPLNAILNNAQAARLALERADAEVKDITPMLDEIVAANERACKIIRRARGFASRGDSERVPVDLNALVTEAGDLLASDALLRNAVVTVHAASTPCLVAGDSVQLLQVIMNLATNALDAVSRTAVGMRKVELAVIAASGDCVWVAVIDSGPGIPGSMLARVFEPLFSTKAEGLGLGLDIASSIVHRHGGSIWVANNRDVGAHVVIGLPLMKRGGSVLREHQP